MDAVERSDATALEEDVIRLLAWSNAWLRCSDEREAALRWVFLNYADVGLDTDSFGEWLSDIIVRASAETRR